MTLLMTLLKRVPAVVSMGLAALSALPVAAQRTSPEPGTVWSKPALVTFEDGRQRPYEEGLIFVEENRNDPDSRIIGIRFMRFRSTAEAPGEPVFYLPGGPGSTVDPEELTRPRIRLTIETYTQAGDLVMLDQRGNSNVAFHPDMKVDVAAQPLDRPASTEPARRALRQGVANALDTWTEAGVDLAGYDIVQVVEDLDDARRALGYDDIILRGNSFGSQWSFSFLRTYPEHVARAVLGGIEPIDFGYDRPAHVWRAMQRIGQRAAADPKLAAYLDDQSLDEIIVDLLERLDTEPVTVEITLPDGRGPVSVVLNGDDLRASLMRFDIEYYMRSGLARWPKFILEMHRGDFRYLGLLRVQARQSRTLPLVFLTIDNSLGISPQREKVLGKDPAREILGDINAVYHWTRDMMPVEEVDNAFRQDVEIDVPVLMIQGDLDMNTPIENAEHAVGLMSNGHLLRVNGGTHLAIYEAMQFEPRVREALLAYLRDGKLDAMPESIKLESPDFASPETGASLYERALKR